jgi:hypothetical protein
MIDLRDHLESIAGPAAVPSTADIDADLARGRRALRRRRAGLTAAGSVLSVAAVAAAFSVAAGPGPGAGLPDRPPAVVAARLVAYEGAQPKGFTVDKVPAGWFVQGDEKYGLWMAPDKVKNPPAGIDPSKAPLYDSQNYTGKIVIYLESKDQNGPPRTGTPVQVGDLDGMLVKSLPGMTPDGPMPTRADGDTGWSLWVELPSGVHVIVQFWEGLGLSRDQMVELAAGVHVHPDAEQSAG